MALPKFFEFFRPFLEALSDGDIHTPKEVREYIKNKMNLSDEDVSVMLPSGRITYFYDRVGWAKTYLDKAGLVETPSRAKYRITDEGKKALASGEIIDLKYLEKYESFKSFHTANGNSSSNETIEATEEEKSPQEILDDAFNQVNSSLSSQLMDEVMKLSPGQFEKLVVRLLLAMGYGSGIDDAGKVTQLSNDGGIDGIIKEDKLGFDNIYIQAKQWALTQTVGRPEIQKFVGALTGKQAQKGLFITTAKYSADAIEYAGNLLGTKVVLVDGDALMKLMIRHNVGVSTEHIYEVKRIDSDFFEDEL